MESAAELARSIEVTGGRAIAHHADVRSRDSVAEERAAVTQAFGALDMLFNNAGITASAAFMDVPRRASVGCMT